MMMFAAKGTRSNDPSNTTRQTAVTKEMLHSRSLGNPHKFASVRVNRRNMSVGLPLSCLETG